MLEMISNQDNVQIEIAVGSDFWKVVEECEQEVLLIIVKKKCHWCMWFMKTYIEGLFVPTVHNHESFKIVVIDGENNQLPPEYPVLKFPDIYFVHKEKNSYTPIWWETDTYTLQELRDFLNEHSVHFHEADITKSRER